jgi:hypothetical protein
MDYSEFKGFQVLLFFGLPLAFAVWQLIVTQVRNWLSQLALMPMAL